MNLWYLLLLVCCCGHGGRTCCTGHNSCIMPRRDGYTERREGGREKCCRKMYDEMEDCGCREKRHEEDGCSCMMPRGEGGRMCREQRYDCGTQEKPCMDNVPEMNMPSHYPVYPEKCACRE